MTGLTGNEFAVSTWKDYYQLSLRRTEEGLNYTKNQWFSTEHQKWYDQN